MHALYKGSHAKFREDIIHNTEYNFLQNLAEKKKGCFISEKI